MGNCGLPGCADALLNAKNASVMPARQRMRPIKTRGLKKADCEAGFFFIGKGCLGVFLTKSECYRSGQVLVTLFFVRKSAVPRSRNLSFGSRNRAWKEHSHPGCETGGHPPRRCDQTT